MIILHPVLTKNGHGFALTLDLLRQQIHPPIEQFTVGYTFHPPIHLWTPAEAACVLRTYAF